MYKTLRTLPLMFLVETYLCQATLFLCSSCCTTRPSEALVITRKYISACSHFWNLLPIKGVYLGIYQWKNSQIHTGCNFWLTKIRLWLAGEKSAQPTAASHHFQLRYIYVWPGQPRGDVKPHCLPTIWLDPWSPIIFPK